MGFVGNPLPCFHENMRLEKFETKIKEEVVVFRT